MPQMSPMMWTCISIFPLFILSNMVSLNNTNSDKNQKKMINSKPTLKWMW